MASGSRFTLNVNNIQMGLEESIIGKSLDDAIKLVIYDGLGNSFTHSNFKVNFAKPRRPSVKFESDGKITIDPHSYDYEVHHIPILDTSPTQSILLENDNKIYDSDKITWQMNDGNVTAIRVVAKQNGTYSDMTIIPFVAFRKAHILQVRNNQEVDKLPYSFLSGSVFKKNGIEEDNGVQITNLQDKQTLVAYHPNEAEGVEQLNAFGGTTTMYLSIGGRNIAYITFVRSYAGKYFYVYHDDTLYQGVFSDDNRFAFGNNPYRLDSGSFDFSDFSLMGGEGNEVIFQEYVDNTQPIFEPDPIQSNNNNINPPGNQTPQTGTNKPPAPILPSN